MKNLIYQYWYGSEPRESALAGRDNMKAYAEKIGAEYRFERDPDFFGPSCAGLEKKYSACRPIHDDSFLEYDNVLYVDLDVFVTEKCDENIFNQDIKHIGICEEPLQPYLRTLNATTNNSICSRNDKLVSSVLEQKYGQGLLLDSESRPRVFNSGVVVFTNEGMRQAREKFTPFAEHINYYRSKGLPAFYLSDQNYYRAMMCVSGVDFKIMDYKWNSQIHYVRGQHLRVADGRQDKANFVHVQISGADDMNSEAHYRMVNKPVSEWNINKQIQGIPDEKFNSATFYR